MYHLNPSNDLKENGYKPNLIGPGKDNALATSQSEPSRPEAASGFHPSVFSQFRTKQIWRLLYLVPEPGLLLPAPLHFPPPPPCYPVPTVKVGNYKSFI